MLRFCERLVVAGRAALQCHEQPVRVALRPAAADVAVEPHVEARRDRHQAAAVALRSAALVPAHDAQVPLASVRHQVADAEAAQLAHPDARVRQDAHDELVALGRGGLLDLADLLPREHVEDAALDLRLGAAEVSQALLVGAPLQEPVDRRHVRLHGLPRPAGLEQLGGQALQVALRERLGLDLVVRAVAEQHAAQHVGVVLDPSGRTGRSPGPTPRSR
jgi:hypothetical protein